MYLVITPMLPGYRPYATWSCLLGVVMLLGCTVQTIPMLPVVITPVLPGYRPYVSCVSPLGVIKIQRIAEAEDDPAGDAKPEVLSPQAEPEFEH